MNKRLKTHLLTSLSLALCINMLQAQNSADSTSVEKKLATDAVVLNEFQLDDESDDNMQAISGLLNSGKDPFESATRYSLGAYRFRARGYDGAYKTVYINGAEFNEAEGGRFVFNLIGGLNDATRNQESNVGIDPSLYSFGNLGGVNNINMLASQYGKGVKVSLSSGTLSYNARAMATLSTGLMKNGWAFSLSASKRMSIEGMETVKGNFINAWGLAFAAQKKLGKRNDLALNLIYAPTERGMQSAAMQEAYELTGSNLYNPNWGYQSGVVRNAKVATTKAPIAILRHEWKANEDFKLTTALGFKYANSSSTALNWYNSADPRPDYNRYFPSYYADSSETAALLTTAWQTDQSVSQINWNKLYQINYLANMSSLSARYIVEERHNDQLALNLNSTANWKINKNFKVDAGIHASSTKGMHYKKLNDLLGAEYWMDVDQFAERDYNGNTEILQNDINNPNRQVRVGDTFGYNYNIFVHKADAWANAKYAIRKFDFYAAAAFKATQFYREGMMKNGRSPENSYGEGAKHNFLDYSNKAGVSYKLTGRHIFTANASYETNAPKARNSYISDKIKDDVIEDLKSEKVFSADANYFLRLPKLSARLTAYRTQFTDQMEQRSFFTDTYNTFVTETTFGINKTHQGIELGIEAKINSLFTPYGALSLGQYLYTSRPTTYISSDNGTIPDTKETIYMKNFFVSGTPQTAATLGLKFNLPKYWFIDLNANYAERSYIDIFKISRTSETLTKYDLSEEQITAISDQEELKGGYLFNASLGKSFKIKKKYNLNLNVSVNNVLDNKEIQTGGYEQTRVVRDSKTAYPSKYYYGYGRTWIANLALRF